MAREAQGSGARGLVSAPERPGADNPGDPANLAMRTGKIICLSPIVQLDLQPQQTHVQNAALNDIDDAAGRSRSAGPRVQST